jgi:hypothetical protein
VGWTSGAWAVLRLRAARLQRRGLPSAGAAPYVVPQVALLNNLRTGSVGARRLCCGRLSGWRVGRDGPPPRWRSARARDAGAAP